MIIVRHGDPVDLHGAVDRHVPPAITVAAASPTGELAPCRDGCADRAGLARMTQLAAQLMTTASSAGHVGIDPVRDRAYCVNFGAASITMIDGESDGVIGRSLSATLRAKW